MKKITIGLLMVAMLPTYSFAQRIQQVLGRGVVAVTDVTSTSDTSPVMVTWRKLVQDPDSCTYNLYMRASSSTEYTKVNTSPITKTNFSTTRSVVPYNTELAVTTVKNSVESGKETTFLFKQQPYKDVFMNIDFETKILNPNDYKVKYIWPADLDGDGEMNEFIVDRLYTGGVSSDSDEESDTSVTSGATQHKLQAYTSNGKCLWTVDMGPNVNIDAGQNDMVLAYDINCDGKAEVIIKSSDGTRFWDKTNETWGKYVFGKTNGDTDNDGIIDYCVSSVTTRNPPFYISVINGLTGEEITSAELDYTQVHDGVDQYSRNNRADYMSNLGYYQMGGHFAICYFDGIHPSLAMECLDRSVGTQTHHNYVFAFGYDWNGNTASNFHHSYTWSRNDKTPWPAEFHQLRVCDVDGDGIDEMLQGGYGVNTTKGMLFSAGIGHGDRYRVSDINPDRPGLETFAIQQSNLLGELIYDAATGKHLKEVYLSNVSDVGRGECMDVDPSHKGYEFYSTMQNLYDCKGNVIAAGTTPFPYEGIWWNGDLLREVLSSPGGSNYTSNVMVTTYGGSRLIQFSKESSWAVHAGPAVRPAFIGDMIGDWREEVILMKQNASTSTGIVGYSTDIASDYSIPCLQQDAHYRLDCTTRGYYQSPNTDFYLGTDMPAPPIYPSIVTDLRWKSGSSWNVNGAGFTSFNMGLQKNYVDDSSVIFDISGENTDTIQINGDVRPSMVYLMVPKSHDYVFGGSGKLTGSMNLYKSMQGTTTFNNNLTYTGKTEISEGRLDVNGTITGPVQLLAKGTLGGNVILYDEIQFEGALNYEGCRLAPGTSANPYGIMTFNKNLTLPGNVFVEEGLQTLGKVQNGKIFVNGNLTLKATNTFTINLAEEKPVAGSYVLAECTGTLNANVDSINVRGLLGVAYDVKIEGKQIILVINTTRNAGTDVHWNGINSEEWDYRTKNFLYNNVASTFVTNDQVVFGDLPTQRIVKLNDMMVTNGVTFDFDNDTYTLCGDGGISGIGGLTKNGKGELIVDLANNDYTGATVINGGTLTVNNLADAGNVSAIGASSVDTTNLVINGATLKIDAYNMATDHGVTVKDTATVNIANSNGSLSLKGVIRGDGYILKTGEGQLNFNYAGENPFAGIILKQGKISQGNGASTFGKIGSPMVLAGGTLSLIANTGYTNMPVFDYITTIEDGTTNTLSGSFRCYIKGSFVGSGTINYISGGDRCDLFSDFSKFTGILNTSGTVRLVQATDISQASVVVGSGSTIGHYTSGSYETLTSLTSKFGSLSSTAADANVAYGKYETGYNNEDATYAGVISASQITKVGTGRWTLTGTGSSANILVKGGILDLENGTATPVDIKTIYIYDGAMITGTGLASGIIIYKGGIMTAGKSGYCGTLSVSGNVSLASGSTILCKVNQYSNDKFNVSGNFVHHGDTIRIKVDNSRTLNIGDVLTIFTGSGIQSGTYIIDGGKYIFDTSSLLTDGKLTVSGISTKINANFNDDEIVNVYTTDGILLRQGVAESKALDGLTSGVYFINGKKISKK